MARRVSWLNADVDLNRPQFGELIRVVHQQGQRRSDLDGGLGQRETGRDVRKANGLSIVQVDRGFVRHGVVGRQDALPHRRPQNDGPDQTGREHATVGNLTVVSARLGVVVPFHANGQRDDVRFGPDPADNGRGFVGRDGADDLPGGTDFERPHHVRDDRVDLPPGQGQVDRAVPQVAVPEAVDAVPADLGHGAHNLHPNVAGNQRQRQHAARLERDVTHRLGRAAGTGHGHEAHRLEVRDQLPARGRGQARNQQRTGQRRRAAGLGGFQERRCRDLGVDLGQIERLGEIEPEGGRL